VGGREGERGSKRVSERASDRAKERDLCMLKIPMHANERDLCMKTRERSKEPRMYSTG
jgi:hypothetical protein